MTKKDKPIEEIKTEEKTYGFMVACNLLNVQNDGVKLYLSKKHRHLQATLTEWENILKEIIK